MNWTIQIYLFFHSILYCEWKQRFIFFIWFIHGICTECTEHTLNPQQSRNDIQNEEENREKNE